MTYRAILDAQGTGRAGWEDVEIVEYDLGEHFVASEKHTEKTTEKTTEENNEME